MDILLRAKDKKNLIAGKTYIGTSMYKDCAGNVWSLAKEGNDFLIKREASKKFDKSKTEAYWGKIFGKQMLKDLFNKSVVAKSVTAHIGDKNYITASLSLTDHESDACFGCDVKISKSGNAYVLETRSDNERYNNLASALPQKIALILDTFDIEESAEVLADVVASNDFHKYLVHLAEIDRDEYTDDFSEA